MSLLLLFGSTGGGGIADGIGTQPVTFFDDHRVTFDDDQRVTFRLDQRVTFKDK